MPSDTYRSLVKAIAIIVALFGLGFGLWMLARAQSGAVVRIYLQTDRPAYLVGQTVRVRFVIATETALSYWSNYTPNLKIVDGENKLVPNTTGVDDPSGNENGAGDRGVLRPGNTTLKMYGWRRGRVLRQWFDLGYLGYHIDRPGSFTIVAEGPLEDYIVKASPPVTIQILTSLTSRTRPPDMLTDARTNALFRSLESEYVSLRSGLAVGHIPERYDYWEQERADLQNQVDQLPSSGNPKSSYVQVNANLENAIEALGAAEERAFQCDAPSEKANLAVSDYFIGAVRRELATGEANVGDAANPPPYASPSGYCKPGLTATNTCPKPSADVRYLGGPSPILPRGLTFKGTVIASVEVGRKGNPININITKTSGNARVDQSVLDAARRSRYLPAVMGCAASDSGLYSFRADFPPKAKPR